MLNPFALPVHPSLVHFPIAMLSVAWLCVLARYATGDARWDERSRLFEVVGVVLLPPVIVAAFVDTRGFGFLLPPKFDAPLVWHMIAGLTASAAFTTHLLWRPQVPAIDVSLATAGMLALLGAGLIGAEMVYGA